MMKAFPSSDVLRPQYELKPNVLLGLPANSVGHPDFIDSIELRKLQTRALEFAPQLTCAPEYVALFKEEHVLIR